MPYVFAVSRATSAQSNPHQFRIDEDGRVLVNRAQERLSLFPKHSSNSAHLAASGKLSRSPADLLCATRQFDLCEPDQV
jgi:hypothetical protein